MIFIRNMGALTRVFVLFTSFGISLTTVKADLLSSSAVTDWGEWGDLTSCPSGTVAQSFQIKTENATGYEDGDHTALNGIRLFCGDPKSRNTENVTSTVGPWGEWGIIHYCGTNRFLTGFQLRSEAARVKQDEDETSVNNVRFFCSSLALKNTNEPIEGDGQEWGDWTDPQHCPKGKAICGIKTQVEPERNDDNTSLNNVEMTCCFIRQKTKSRKKQATAAT